MSIKKKKYYRVENILKHEANYNMLLGEKSNGKSYAVKEHAVMEALEGKGKLIYMRRYEMDVKASDVDAYFADAPIFAISNGEYSLIHAYRGIIYAANYDENKNKIVNGKELGRIVWLTGYHHFASQAFVGYKNIIFEEFITDSIYLENEPTTLQKMVSTILRDKNGSCWLVGNTISRVCPYFLEWCLDKIPKQKPGTIDDYFFENEDGTKTKIAVEYCENLGTSSSMFFGKAREHIAGGQWQTKAMPKLEKKYSEYTRLYEVLLKSSGFSFVLNLLQDEKTGAVLVYVYPFTGTRRIRRILSDEYSEDILTSKNLNVNIKPELIMTKLVNEGMVSFSDNLTGSDFTHVLEQRGGIL